MIHWFNCFQGISVTNNCKNTKNTKQNMNLKTEHEFKNSPSMTRQKIQCYIMEKLIDV